MQISNSGFSYDVSMNMMCNVYIYIFRNISFWFRWKVKTRLFKVEKTLRVHRDSASELTDCHNNKCHFVMVYETLLNAIYKIYYLDHSPTPVWQHFYDNKKATRNLISVSSIAHRRHSLAQSL